MRRVAIIGAGGHGKVIADVVKCCGDEVVGFLDDKSPDKIPQFNIIGTFQDIEAFDRIWYFPAIGSSAIREKLMLHYPDIQWYTAIHPTAVIADDVTVGYGSCVMANAVINSGTAVGNGCIINTAATIDHDCFLEDYVHISPGAHLAGVVSVGKKAWVGIGANVVNNVSIHQEVTIGAGAVVIQSIFSSGTYVGCPVRKISHDSITNC